MLRVRGWLPLFAWIAALTALLAGFSALGDGALGTPALVPATASEGWSAWSTWAAREDPAVAVVALLRLGVLGLAWYLLAVTVLGLVARGSRAARLVTVAGVLTVPVARRFLQQLLGTAVVAGVTVASPVAAVAAGPPGAGGEVVSHAPVASDSPAEIAFGPPARRLPSDPLAGADATATVADDEADATTSEAGPAVHEVVVGEHLWSIASAHLADRLDRVPTDAEVARYWQHLIDRNRDRLVDAEDPDLILPGQRFELPEPIEVDR